MAKKEKQKLNLLDCTPVREPDLKWTEDENGEYYSSEEKENFDWTLMQYDGQFEELMNTDNID